jgi:DNA-directed RNA polymerase subunit RPC12/RpoP
MNDLISRQEAIETALEYQVEYCGAAFDKKMQEGMIKKLKDIPSAESVKREECEYVITKGKAGYHEEYKCSACGDSFYWSQDKNIPSRFNYCRNCGRKVIRFIEKEVNTAKRESE